MPGRCVSFLNFHLLQPVSLGRRDANTGESAGLIVSPRHCAMQHCALIPDKHVSDTPCVRKDKFGLCDVFEQLADRNRPAFLGQIFDHEGMAGDVQHRLPVIAGAAAAQHDRRVMGVGRRQHMRRLFGRPGSRHQIVKACLRLSIQDRAVREEIPRPLFTRTGSALTSTGASPAAKAGQSIWVFPQMDVTWSKAPYANSAARAAAWCPRSARPGSGPG